MGPSPVDPMINEPAVTEAVMQMHAANEAATFRSRLLKTAALAVAPLVLAACAHLPKDDVRADEAAATTTEQVNPTTTATTQPEAACEDTWEMTGLNHGKHRVDVNGMSPEDRAADTEEEARTALDKWVSSISTDPKIFGAAASEILQDEIKPAELVDDANCATDKAVETKARMQAAIMLAEVVPGEIPADSTNTGVNSDGDLVASDNAGIKGDRSGINVDFKDNKDHKDFGVLERCKNPTFPGKPKLPKGPTDNILEKRDDGILPGNPNVPADQDPGTPDRPGKGPAGQKPNKDGFVDGEKKPEAPATTAAPVTTAKPHQPPATTAKQPTVTAKPAPATTAVENTIPPRVTVPKP